MKIIYSDTTEDEKILNGVKHSFEQLLCFHDDSKGWSEVHSFAKDEILEMSTLPPHNTTTTRL